MENRGSFNTKIGAVLAIIGSAVGLGNLWRFPYVVGQNGGAAFILIYFIFVIGLCVPLMVAELLIGRRGGSHNAGCFKAIKEDSKFYLFGYVGILSAFVILSFYSVVGGWVLNYLGQSIISFNNPQVNELSNIFNNFVINPVRPLVLHLVFIVLTALIVIAGVEKGIEKISKFFMPILFILIIVLAIRSVTLDGAVQGLNFLFKADFSKVTNETIFEALGQAFFSLSLGMGCVMTYGSYMCKNSNIIKSSIIVSISDTLFALIAGIAIIPAVFSFNLQPTAGPGLVFIVLPEIFAKLNGGSFFQIIFFFVVFIAAISSSISLLEVVVSYVVEEFKITRKKATIITTIIIAIIGCFCSLSEGVLSDFKIAGMTLFSLFDYVSSNILLPFGSIGIAIFVGWRMKKKDVFEELSNNGQIKIMCKSYFILVIKYVAPIAISLILLKSLFW